MGHPPNIIDPKSSRNTPFSRAIETPELKKTGEDGEGVMGGADYVGESIGACAGHSSSRSPPERTRSPHSSHGSRRGSILR